MIKWLQKSKPQKIPGPKINRPKIPSQISKPPKFPDSIKMIYNRKNKLEFEFLCLQAGFSSTTNNLHIVLNTQKFPYLSQATKKILTKLSYAKKILE